MYSKRAHTNVGTGGHELSNIICTNCSQLGHTSKFCSYPITSYGVIAFRIEEHAWNQADALLAGASTGLEGGAKLQFLLIQRRDSIGFVELMRGKYKLSETEYILSLLKGMTAEERGRILTTPFEQLWEALWGKPVQGGHAYRHEKEQARQKLESLRPSLAELIARAGPAWATPEWGFPKGRRDLHESEYACAMREFWEETNLREADVLPVRGLEPLTEKFTGSNHIQYCHKYYLAYVPNSVGPADYEAAARVNEHIRREVGALRWCSAEEGLALFRPEQVEKKELLQRICGLLRTYCPLRLANTT